eukprot:Skav208553  [mRNA]  locus=scaffold1216:632395:633273:+ [translate_table: standard]
MKKLLPLEDRPKLSSRGPELTDLENVMEAVFGSDRAKREAEKMPAGAAKPKARADTENLGDCWELDQEKGAWCKIRKRPRKRLIAPVGNDCPFGGGGAILATRVTEWKCKNRASTRTDDWQVSSYQRISSRSWVGKIWFFPKEQLGPKRVSVHAAVCNAEAKPDLLKGESAVEFTLQDLDRNEVTSIRAMFSKVEPVSRSNARKTVKKGEPTMFEFCCSENSTLGQANAERGINHFRLSKSTNDLTDPGEASLNKLIAQFPGCDLCGSLPCDPWSKWQARASQGMVNLLPKS